MAAIIKLSQNEWVKYFLCKWWGGKCECSLFCANGGNQSWQVWVSLRGKSKVAESKMAEFKMASWVRMNEFESDWISFSQSQSGVRVFLSESERRKQGVWIQHGRIQDDCHHQVVSEWMSEVFLIQHGRIQDGCHHQVESEWMSEGFFVQMVGTNLGKCEWVWEEKLRWLKPRWPNSRWQNSRWLPSSSWVRMNKFESD